MVTQYGMTERLGAIKLGSGDAEPFLGRDIGHGRDYSEEVAAIVDEEVSKLISTAHQEAFDILTENRDVLDDLVRALFEKETLDRAEVAAVFQPLRLWPKRPAWTGSDERVPSMIPPVTPPPPPPIPINGQNGPNGKAAGGQAARARVIRCRLVAHHSLLGISRFRRSYPPLVSPILSLIEARTFGDRARRGR